MGRSPRMLLWLGVCSLFLCSFEMNVVLTLRQKGGALFREAGEKIGQAFDLARDQKLYNWMTEVGFVNVKEHPFKLPLGPWPADPKMKDVGNYNLATTDQGLEGYAVYLFTKVLGWYVVL